jgi:protein gp37
MDRTGLDWCIVGGESGPNARPMQEAWAMNMKVLADANGTAFYFKQWGTWDVNGIRRSKSANGHLLGGVEYYNYPTPRVNF